jgi:hypothetical protein
LILLSQSYISKFARAGQFEGRRSFAHLLFLRSEEVMAGEENASEPRQILEKDGFPLGIISEMEG